MRSGTVLDSIQLVGNDTSSYGVVGGRRRHVGVRDQTLVGNIGKVILKRMRLKVRGNTCEK